MKQVAIKEHSTDLFTQRIQEHLDQGYELVPNTVYVTVAGASKDSFGMSFCMCIMRLSERTEKINELYEHLSTLIMATTPDSTPESVCEEYLPDLEKQYGIQLSAEERDEIINEISENYQNAE